ncbi:MAG TPA: sulfurtransferase complex subunit TusB [Thermoplasmata archaeon]|nr:sulfurtransferase complex subunit TusB [Thermoplasmata archaeon]
MKRDTMKTAFIVLKSPQDQDPTHMIRTFSSKEDSSVILVEDGVLQALSSTASERIEKSASEVLVSKEDLEAKGFSQSDLKIGKAIGYPEIVDCIMERTERTIAV